QGSPAGAAANACVLLVDDEPGIITGVSEMLERLGYKVVSETDPRSALKTFERHADDFDLIITDMTMPGFTGEDLIREIRRIRPTVPVLLCTGYNEKIAGKSHKELGIRGLLLKPFAVEELARKIRTVLGETAA
ncbi:MAG: response regulator, partial [Deltaproteobacteria bacterium]|nr:response regulator [Deltaproteobacteria bacterium]